VHRPVSLVFQIDQLDNFLHASFEQVFRPAVEEARCVVNDLASGHVLVVARVLGQVADTLADLHAIARHTSRKMPAPAGLDQAEQKRSWCSYRHLAPGWIRAVTNQFSFQPYINPSVVVSSAIGWEVHFLVFL
jgi:hypothetical protein